MSAPGRFVEKARHFQLTSVTAVRSDRVMQSSADYEDDQFSGKSPVERVDYEGLQLDTREKKGFETHQPWTSSDKLKRELEGLQASPVATHGNPYLPAGRKPGMIDDVIADPKTREPRICGMRRKMFWILFGVILGIIVIAAIIGGVVGGTKSSSPAPSPPPPPRPLAPYDIMAASPIKALSFENNNTQNGNVQSFRIHYQSVNGNIKEINYDGILPGWKNANPIFTDAQNHSGLATYTYLNGTTLMGAIIYHGANGYLQEKRKNLSTDEPWLSSSLSNYKTKTNGSFPLENDDSAMNPANDWDGWNIAAVYSSKFSGGPGARLYYHFTALNGSQWIQELKWDQTDDTWEVGAVLTGASPNSHITATIDDQHRAVRVFYCAGNGTLQESWQNMTQANGTYNLGATIPKLLVKNDADIAALTIDGSTLVYYYSDRGTPGINELNITGLPARTVRNGTNVVAEPALLSDDGSLSVYTPLTAALARTPGGVPAIHVFYADITVSTDSGYTRLSDVSRLVDNVTWPASQYGRSEGQIQLPLGTESADPHA
ncbi:hypothetical protein MMC16_003272 [Acarospora aff. strigata]|nr:hypothetical protein [Acarospora aff. strigata]